MSDGQVKIESASPTDWRTADVLHRLGRGTDVMLAPLFPGWARRRSENRLRMQATRAQQELLSTYAAAEKRRVERDWRPGNKSADQAIVGDLDTLRARARAAIRDDWAAASIVGGYRRHVVGIGITPRSAARNPVTGESMEEFNAEIDALWKYWGERPEFCDIERKLTMLERQHLWVNELVSVGETFTVLSYVRRPDCVGLVLQAIEVEQLDAMATQYEGRAVRNGIEIDEFGAAVAYHVHAAGHPLERYRTNSSRIDAERMIQIFRVDRVRQTHGVTWLSAVLRKLRHAGMYDEYMMIKARIEAAFGAIATQTDSPADSTIGLAGLTGETGEDSVGNLELNLQPGMIPFLPKGADVKFPPPASPNSQYGPFTEEQIKQIAAGAGLDYGTVARCFSKGNFSSQRQGLIEVWAETDPIQRMLINRGLRRIREQFKAHAILEGRVKAPEFFGDPVWRRSYLQEEWQGPPKTWIDPAKGAAAAKIRLASKLATYQGICNELGIDWRDMFRQIAEEEKFAKELGIDLSSVASVLPSEPRPERKQPEESDSDDKKADDDGLTAAMYHNELPETVGEELVSTVLEN